MDKPTSNKELLPAAKTMHNGIWLCPACISASKPISLQEKEGLCKACGQPSTKLRFQE